MLRSSVSPRSLGSIVQIILRLKSSQTCITQEAIADRAQISDRHVRRCLKALRKQEILTWVRNPQWNGSGVRFSYDVEIERAIAFGYLDQDFLDLLDLARERLMAQAA